MNLVYGSSSSSSVDFVVFFGDECLIIDGLEFICPRACPRSFASSSLEVTSAVHHAVWMSSRRLPVIIFFSLIEFMFMFMLVLRGVHSVAGGGFYILCVI